MWVGNWRERVVSLGAPPSDARVLAFIALGERFFFSLVLSLALSPLSWTFHSLCGYRWVVRLL